MTRVGLGRKIDRRTLLVGGGVGIGLLVAWQFWPRQEAPPLRAGPGETRFDAWLKIGSDGRVIVAVPQAEVGQGSWTSLPQILADELGADWRSVGVEPAPISPLYANLLLADEAAADSGLPGLLQGLGRRSAEADAPMMTAGSTSIRAFEAKLRAAGAGARALLCLEAADRWNVDWTALEAHDGFVWHGNDRLSFAELAEPAAGRTLPAALIYRNGTDHRLTGRSLPRLDLPAKIDGSARYAGDVRLPDMVYAALRSGPPGTTLAGLDRAAADHVPGALAVIRNPEWVAVAGTNWWAAGKALDAMRPRFTRPEPAADDRSITAALTAALDGDGGSRIVETGDISGPFPGASPIRARYAVGLAPSAPIEPLCATARIEDGKLEIWAPTQAPGAARAAAAEAIGFAAEDVILYPMPVGGGYGRKLEHDAVRQAAIIAATLRRPVQLTWPRIQDIGNDTPRPAAAADLTAWLQQGRIRAWQARIAAPATASEVATRLGATGRLVRPDAAAVAGATPPYAADVLAVDHVPTDIGLRTGYWRGAAHSYTAFFTESFIDELAHAAGFEPLSFRVSLLGNNPRLVRALNTATSIGGWDGGGPGSGMGIACHQAFGAFIAVLVEVSMTADQRLRVQRAVAAVDCGRQVNPELIKQQIEGGLIHGLSAATGRPLQVLHGVPTALTIGAYGLPSLRDAPDVSVELLDSDEAPGGVTELAVPVAAPAIANALFSLTGQRARGLPIVPGQMAAQAVHA